MNLDMIIEERVKSFSVKELAEFVRDSGLISSSINLEVPSGFERPKTFSNTKIQKARTNKLTTKQPETVGREFGFARKVFDLKIIRGFDLQYPNDKFINPNVLSEYVHLVNERIKFKNVPIDLFDSPLGVVISALKCLDISPKYRNTTVYRRDERNRAVLSGEPNTKFVIINTTIHRDMWPLIQIVLTKIYENYNDSNKFFELITGTYK